jgi:hypothetical protein
MDELRASNRRRHIAEPGGKPEKGVRGVKVLTRFPKVTFYALVLVSLALASGAGRKWAG